MEYAFNYIMNNKGINTDESYPYTGRVSMHSEHVHSRPNLHTWFNYARVAECKTLNTWTLLVLIRVTVHNLFTACMHF